LEGIIAKKADSPYRRGRTPNWVKIKTAHDRHIDERKGEVERMTRRSSDARALVAN
jgi:ATP-dependent DNA ligase